MRIVFCNTVKKRPLTVDEINKYGETGTIVNMYTKDSVRPAYNENNTVR